MRDVTDQEITDFREQGFVVLPGLLDDAELAHWRTVVDAAVAGRAAASPRGDDAGKELTPEEQEYYQRVFVQRVNLWQTDAGVRDLVLDERLGRLAATLAGLDGVRLWHDQALVKPPCANPTGWHLDLPYWSFTSPHALSMWVALDDATPENGCLYFLPGTHHARRYENVLIGSEVGALFDVYPEWREIDPVPAPMPAGSAAFHNGLTAHAAGANMTARPRRAMTLQFMPVGATYNGIPHDIVFPPDVLAGLRVGDVLDDEAINPLLWTSRDDSGFSRSRRGRHRRDTHRVMSR
jgi:phytanoyl-CoA hydroxylase